MSSVIVFLLLLLLLLLFDIGKLLSLHETKWLNDIKDYQLSQSDGNNGRYEVSIQQYNENKKQKFDRYRRSPENHENEEFKKIDILSHSLRTHMDEFRNDTERMEIIFLVDASSSVGQENFQSELNFVRKVLSDLSVDKSSTRIAIVTFAGKESILRNIDRISPQESHGNKCTLLNEELKKIGYTGGGTYTRGALMEALAILERSRKDARKVVFLITDGFSNGGDPKPVAKLLRNLGAVILTFGIRTGNVQELHDIASTPGSTHSYFLDSFKEFESLARHALHRDLQGGKYIPLESNKSCLHLCNNFSNNSSKNKLDENCCDELAECNCGTSSGHYACICANGYFGSGLKGFCHPCPNGTYGQAENPGDSSEHCSPCPNVNHITLKIPAISPLDCVCPTGFSINGTICEAITCNKLTIPENGYLVKASACTNVVNAACGLRCRIGFHLAGDSIRLCRKDGEWSGMETQCLLKTCPTLRAPQHGKVSCSHDDEKYDVNVMNFESSVLPIDSSCQFKCDSGYQLLGSKIRNCLPVSRWDGLKVGCKQIKCEPLSQISNGVIMPETCTGTKKLVFGTNCSISCLNDFNLEGPAHRKCTGSNGLWSHRKKISRCIDKTPPVIVCPQNSTWKTIPRKRYALPTWSTPIASDNSNKKPIVWSKPHIVFPWKSKIGRHLITYLAQDASGNQAKCKFTITTIDEEPPAVENCTDPPTYLSTDSTGAGNVTWDEPRFNDNSGKKVLISKSHNQGSFFPIGRNQVIYNATDSSNNSISCIINITIQNACQEHPFFLNGQSNCNEVDDQAIRCVITCDEGYIFQLEQPEYNVGGEIILTCNSQSAWNDSYISSCSLTELPESIGFGGSILLESNDSICEDLNSLRKLKSEINNDLTNNLADSCNENGIYCRSAQIDINCKSELPNIKNIRRRRSSKDLENSMLRTKRIRDRIEVKFRFIGKILAEHRHDPQRGMEKLRTEINEMTKSGKLNLLNEKTNREIANIILNFRTIFDADIHEICDPGKVFRLEKCAKCPVGTFHNSTKDFCQSCRLSEYQDETGSTACKKCPDKTSTKRIHSTIQSECIKLCLPGHFSKRRYHRNQKVTMEPCMTCEIGFYQPFYGRFQCFPCPENTTTDFRGATSIQHCNSIKDSNFCQNNSCLNDGNCTSMDSGFSCDCSDNFVGSRCENLRDHCESSPCLNGGTCIFDPNQIQLNFYICTCAINFTGRNCEIFIDECSSNPCQNNGTCVSSENDFICNCLDGFTGEFCEISLDLCQPGICEEGSTCIISNGTWFCLCKPGYLGRHCQLVPCDWLPCHENAICINLDEEKTTQNSFRCECPSGFKGDDCLTKIKNCNATSCKNDGICIDKLTHYICKCSLGFDGQNCENALSSDFILYFIEPGITNYIMMSGPSRNLSEFTICLWIQSSDTFNYGTVFSYAIDHEDNEITLTDYNGLVFYVKGESIVTDISLNDGYWHFLCVTWESLNGTWFIYVDGNLRDHGINLAANLKIQENGIVVIGQEQDQLRGKFSASESFIGRITLLDVFETALKEEIIRKLIETCDNYTGTLIPWSAMRKKINGNVKVEQSPFCKGCPLPNPPLHGHINVSKDQMEITYYCEPGYIIRSENHFYNFLKAKCLKQGVWEVRDVSMCSKISCGFPGYFPRGHIIGTLFLFGDEISHDCDKGYQLQGNKSRVCQADGNWSGKPPICIGVTCKKLPSPENGYIDYIKEEHEREDVIILHVGQQLEFHCYQPFKLNGKRILTCNNSGEWDSETPKCEALGCLPPIISKNSLTNISQDSTNKSPDIYQFGEVAEIFCDSGFKFKVDERQIKHKYIECSKNGGWIGFIPNCVPLRCLLPEINHGRVKNLPDEVTPGSELVIECEAGYERPEEKIICEETEKWSIELTNCLRKRCSGVSNHQIAGLFVGKSVLEESEKLRHFRLAIEGDHFGDKLILRCNDDANFLSFNLTNKHINLSEVSWKCNEKGEWKLQELDLDDIELRTILLSQDLCYGGTCPPPMIPSNAILVDSNKNTSVWRINSTVSYECRNGFILQGFGISTCMSTGSWSGLALCRPASCPDPPKLQNAEVISDTNYKFGITIQYKCLPGFRLFGQGSSRCLASGKWSRIQGKCS